MDLFTVFGNTENLQVAVLSQKEMQETQGAWIQFALAILNGGRILLTGYTRHGLNQAISRNGVGVSNKVILNTLRNPKSAYSDIARKTTTDKSNNGAVILNQEGRIVTTWGKPRITKDVPK